MSSLFFQNRARYVRACAHSFAHRKREKVNQAVISKAEEREREASAGCHKPLFFFCFGFLLIGF